MDPQWISAIGASLGGMAAAVTAVVAVGTLNRARKDGKEQARPMLAAELRHIPYVHGSQALIIRNYGPTIARNVSVKFDPELPDPDPKEAHRSMIGFLKKRYSMPIPTLVPGAELDNIYFDATAGAGGQYESREPLPNPVTVTLAYEAPDGEPYKDKFVLDTEVLKKRTSVSSSADPDNKIKEATKYLKHMDSSIKRIASATQRPPEAPHDHEDLVNRMLPKDNNG